MSDDKQKQFRNVSTGDVAVVGLGCRMPGGVRNLDDLWQLLAEGRDAITEIGPDRWMADRYYHPSMGKAGFSYSFAAGLVDDIKEFDPEFFGMSQREAIQIDPQHRLLLQTSWEAFESAGIDPFQLPDRDVAVFVGTSATDYGTLFNHDISMADAHFVVGNTQSFAANRLSYFYDFHGESSAIDTACSSSMLALHRGVKAIHDGHCEMALVGGAHALISPNPFVAFSRAGMLSPTGRCHTFSAKADGYVRSEGVLSLVLVDKARAERENWPILGVIKGSGVNTDGYKGTLLSTNGDRQAELMAELKDALALSADQYIYFEAHGTGTAVGDPAECQAIGTAIAQGRRTPLPIGSIKSQVGHAEPASGLMGVAKALCLCTHRERVANLHFDEPNPAIDFEGLNLSVLCEREEWPSRDDVADPVIGVNSFGFGGVNVHAVIAPYEREAVAGQQPASENAPVILTARSPESLRGMAQQTCGVLGSESLTAVASSLAYNRAQLEQRCVIWGKTEKQTRDFLEAFQAGDSVSDIAQEKVLPGPVHKIFVYAGNGTQWAGMGKELAAQFPCFAESLNEIDGYLTQKLGWSVAAWIAGDQPEEDLGRGDIGQPVLMALQIALTDTLNYMGVKADCVLGHSVGEVAAAYAAGALTKEQAAHVISMRCKAQEPTKGKGTVAAAGIGAETFHALRDRLHANENADDLTIASFNAPEAITIAGQESSIDRLGALLKAERKSFKKLIADYPYHSVLMEPIKDDFLARLDGFMPEQTQSGTQFISTVTGDYIANADLDASYWWRNIREPVQFLGGFEAALAKGQDAKSIVAIEVGPAAILQSYMRKIAGEVQMDGELRLLSIQQKNQDNGQVLRKALGQMYALGLTEACERFVPRADVRLSLPLYPWNNRSIWFSYTAEGQDRFYAAKIHPLLGYKDRDCWTQIIDPEKYPLFADHQWQGKPVFPGAFFFEMALAAAHENFPSAQGGFVIENMHIMQPLVFAKDRSTRIRLQVLDEQGRFAISSRPYTAEDVWTQHVHGRIYPEPYGCADVAIPDMVERIIPGDAVYERASRIGLDYKGAFRSLSQVSIHDNRSVSAIFDAEGQGSDYLLDPVCVDGAFQMIMALWECDSFKALSQDEDIAYLPFSIERMIVHPTDRPVKKAYACLTNIHALEIAADITLWDDEDQIIATLKSMRFKRVQSDSLVDRDKSAFARRYVSAIPVDTNVLGAVLNGFDGCADSIQDDNPDVLFVNALALACLKKVWDSLDDDVRLGKGVQDEALYNWFIETLVKGGFLRRDLDSLIETHLDFPSYEEIWGGLYKQAPDLAFLLLLFSRAAEEIEQALTSEALLSRHADLRASCWRHLLQQDLLIQNAMRSLGGLIENVLQEKEEAARLRILEICDADFYAARHLDIILCAENIDYTILCASEHTMALQGAFQDCAHVTILSTEDFQHRDKEFFDVVIDSRLSPDHMRDDELSYIGENAVRLGGLYCALRLPDGPVMGLAKWLTYQTFLADNELTAEDVIHNAHYGDYKQITGDHDWGVQLFAARRKMMGRGDKTSDITFVVRDSFAAVSVCESLLQGLKDREQVCELISVASCEMFDRGVHDHVRVVYVSKGQETAESLSKQIDEFGSLLAVLRDKKFKAHIYVMADAVFAAVCRVAANEYPEFPIRIIDEAADVEFVLNELQNRDGEIEISYGSQMRKAVRYIPVEDNSDRQGSRVLRVTTPGRFEKLQWDDLPDQEPTAHEVKIRIHETALNFRDLLWAKGLLDVEALAEGFAKPSLGIECAGVVESVGDDVTHLQPGDSVMAYTGHAFADYACVPVHAVAKVPENVSLAQAATIPVSFLTAYYALIKKAQIQSGEKVLIHGASGGLGLASIQVAQYCGAEVFATAGSEEKRAFLKALGVDHVYDSRSLNFADDIRRDTDGYGVDVVMNTLAGPAIEANMRLLAPLGRYLELGKRDLYADSPVGLRPFKNNVSFFGIDMDQIMVAVPDEAQSLFSDMLPLFEDGTFTPLPYQHFKRRDAQKAFQRMWRSYHVGKMVVQMNDGEIAASDREDETISEFSLDQDATYMVVGGTRGFGLETACWLAREGARNLVLVSRSGQAVTVEDQAKIDALTEQGVSVTCKACDITREDDVRDLVASISDLKGVVHAAMVLEDQKLENFDVAQAVRVLAPKVDGARILNDVLLDVQLDFFVVYSSVAAHIGNIGQAAYAAANAYLENLMQTRRTQGQHGLAIAWGPIGDAGYLAQDGAQAVRQQITHYMGAAPLRTDQALAQLKRGLERNETSFVYCPASWGHLQRGLPLTKSRLFTAMSGQIVHTGGEEDAPALIQQLIEAGPKKALDMVVTLLKQELAKLLMTTADRIDPQIPLADMGMDSLLAVELAMEIEKTFGIELNEAHMSSNIHIKALAQNILKIVMGEADEEDDVHLNNLARSHLPEEEISSTLEAVGSSDSQQNAA